MLHRGLIVALCFLPAGAAHCQETEETAVREIVEQSCWPGDGIADPAMLLWFIEHPGDSSIILRNGLRNIPHGNPPAREGTERLHGSARVSRGWNSSEEEYSVESRVSTSIRFGRIASAEFRWAAAEGSGLRRRTAGGGIEIRDQGILKAAVIGDLRFVAAEGLVFGRGRFFAGSSGSRPPGEGPAETARALHLPDRMGLSIPGFSGGARLNGLLLSAGLPAPGGLPSLTLLYSGSALRQSFPEAIDSDEAGEEEPSAASRVPTAGPLMGLRIRLPIAPAWCVGISGATGLRIMGLDVSFAAPGLRFSLEACRQSPGILAGAAAAEVVAGRNIRIAAGGRSFGPGFTNPLASDLESDDGARSEQSGWIAFSADPLPWLRFDARSSGMRKISLAGSAPATVASSRTLLRTEAETPSGLRAVVILSYACRDAVCTVPGEGGTKRQTVRETRSRILRGDFTARLHGSVTLAFRVAASSAPGAGEQGSGDQGSGLLLGLGCRWTPAAAVQLEVRCAVFGTDSYDSRLYLGEQLLPGRARFVMVYGEGERTGLWLRLRPSPHVGIALAASETSRRTPSAYAFSVRTEYALQVDVRL